MATEKTVLICDEDEALLSQLAAELAQSGYDVTTTSNAAQLAQALASGRHAVVVVNPDLKGFDEDALCRFKQSSGTPILLLLAPNSTSRNSFGSCTADDVVEKPVHQGNFATLLDKQYTWNKTARG